MYIIGIVIYPFMLFARAYTQTDETFKRRRRIREMMSKVGGAFAFGSLSACAIAAFVMFGALHLFYKFGLVMFLGYWLGGLFNLFYFTALLGVAGPEGKKGNVPTPSWRGICCRKKKKKKGGDEPKKEEKDKK